VKAFIPPVAGFAFEGVSVGEFRVRMERVRPILYRFFGKDLKRIVAGVDKASKKAHCRRAQSRGRVVSVRVFHFF